MGATEEDLAGERGENRWPVVAAVLVVMVLPFLLPADYTPGPRWLLPAVLGVMLIAMSVADPGRIDRRSKQVRGLRIALIAALVLGSTWATLRLTDDLIHGSPVTKDPTQLLAAGGLVWADLVISFGFLFWELDSGGPGERAQSAARLPDMAFPQHLSPELAPPGWRPVFVDYLYVAFTNALAFSPTDTMPLTHWAKFVMAVQSTASLIILGLVVARAVNILG